MALFIALPLDLLAVDGHNGLYRDESRKSGRDDRLLCPASVAGDASRSRNERNITLPCEIPRYKGHDLERISRWFRSKFRVNTVHQCLRLCSRRFTRMKIQTPLEAYILIS